MAKPKVEIPFLAEALDPATNTLTVLSGATVTIYNRDGTDAAVYSSEDATTPLASNSIFTNSSGRMEGWLNEGRYNIVVSGAGGTTYTQPWDARSGGILSAFGDVLVGAVGPSSQAGFGLGPTQDALVYRSATGEIRTNSNVVFDGWTRINQARLIGNPTNLAVQDSSGANLLKISTSVSGFTDGVNLQQLELGANTGTTNDAVIAGSAGVALRRLGVAAQGVSIGNSAANALNAPPTNSLRIDYAGGATTLQLASTAANTGITIGGDVSLQRSGAGVLRIPNTVNVNTLQINGTALASTHLTDTANIGRLSAAQSWTALNTFTGGLVGQGTAGSYPVVVQTPGDTSARTAIKADGTIEFGPGNAARSALLYFSATNVLRTNSTLRSDSTLVAAYGSGAGETSLGALGPAGTSALVLGGDTALYRSATGVLRTAASAIVDGNLLLGTTVQQGRITLPTGTSIASGISFGDSATVKTDRIDLYRSSAGNLTIDGSITITGSLNVAGGTTATTNTGTAGSLIAAQGLAGEVTVGSQVSGNPTIQWGNGPNMAELYKDGNDKLRTPDSFQVDGTFTAQGTVIEGSTTYTVPTNATVALLINANSVNRYRIKGDGTTDWADATGVFDTTIARSAPGILTLTGTFNSTLGYQVNGVALASTHLSDTAALARLASPTFTGTVTNPINISTTRNETPAGGAATPGYVFTGDTTTGLYSSAAGQVGLATGGTSRLSISSAGAISVPGTLTVGGQAVVVTNDARLTDSRTPAGTAGGQLAGTYPNPSVANGVITNAHIATNAGITDSKLATISTAGKVADTAIPATIARLVDPVFTASVPGAGPQGPTQTPDTNNLTLATTAFVLAQASSITPQPNGVAAVGTSQRYARADHVHITDVTRAPLSAPVFTNPANTGWGTYTGPVAGTVKTLSANSTLNNVIDYIVTLKEALRTMGIVGA